MRWKSNHTMRKAARQRKEIERINKRKNWHDFFCLIPRRIKQDDGTEVYVWFETVERIDFHAWAIYDHGWKYEFRLKHKK